MIQKDLIQRLVEDIARFLAKALKLEGESKIAYIQQYYQTTLEIEVDFWESLTKDNIIDQLETQKGFNIHQLELIAEVLAQEGNTFLQLQEIEKGKAQIQKALMLFHYIDNQQGLFSLERQAKIKQLETLLDK